ILYTYGIYPIILIIVKSFHRNSQLKIKMNGSELPSVSLVVAVYNEDPIVRHKLENLKGIDYPQEKIEFLFGSDGSTDETNEILKSFSFPNFHVELFSQRRGKAAVVNELIARAKGEIIVFSDANTFYNQDTVRKLIENFRDQTVGAACGELRLNSDNQTVGGMGEVSYWNYENTIKKMESSIKTTLGASGGVYAIRKCLFTSLPTKNVVTDDFLIPMHILRQGYKIIYEPTALAFEKISNSVTGEFRRKVRIGAANFHGISEFAPLLNPKYGFIAFALWSHKIIRWSVPFLLLIVFSTSIVLVDNSDIHRVFFLFEFVFIIIGIIGLIAEKVNLRVGKLGLPYYFIAMNAALLLGFINFIFGRQRATWDVVR
ncbi:MAG TPA: glycosyltransferase family 2 protein, partial [Bacteroidota bacterium]|nr:glycosyltransferase family 2 protein [Bacteroidota bacterium]